MAIKSFGFGGGLDTLAAAIPQAIQGFRDQEAFNMQKQEIAAKMAADEFRKKRQEAMDRVAIQKDFELPQGAEGQDIYGLVNQGLLKRRKGMLGDDVLNRQLTQMRIMDLAGKMEDRQTKQAKAEEATAKKKEMTKDQSQMMVDEINRALELSEGNDLASGPLASLVTSLPLVGRATPGYKLEGILKTIQANIGFDKLQAMREASPTGGALGAVSEREIDLLQSTAGRLDPSLPDDVFQDNLKRLANQYMDVIHGPEAGPERYELSFKKSKSKVADKKSKSKTKSAGPSTSEGSPWDDF